jgi:tubulin---tyrosine ligase
MHKMDKVFQHNFSSFSEVFDFLSKIISSKNPYNLLTNKKYTDLFKLTALSTPDSILENTPIFIPKTFISDKNYWVIKPNDLCQGKCIKLCNDKVKILKKMKKYFLGIDRTYKDSEDEMKSSINLHKPKKFLASSLQSEENKNESGSPEIKKKKVLLTRYMSNSIILQKYLEQPLLYKNRKFDIRMWVIVDHCLNVYMFKEGHLKASSEEYNGNNMDPFVHLTNYSVQKNSQNFSKYEFGNEISFSDFQNFLDFTKSKIKVHEDIMPQIKSIIDLSMNSVGKNLNKRNSNFCFQMFGYDFILDKNFKVWLLEINDNPGLSESSPLIKKLVPRMIDDSFRLTLDKIFDTQYDSSVYDKSTGIYKTRFPVEGYSDSENMFEFICNLSN